MIIPPIHGTLTVCVSLSPSISPTNISKTQIFLAFLPGPVFRLCVDRFALESKIDHRDSIRPSHGSIELVCGGWLYDIDYDHMPAQISARRRGSQTDTGMIGILSNCRTHDGCCLFGARIRFLLHCLVYTECKREQKLHPNNKETKHTTIECDPRKLLMCWVKSKSNNCLINNNNYKLSYVNRLVYLRRCVNCCFSIFHSHLEHHMLLEPFHIRCKLSGFFRWASGVYLHASGEKCAEYKRAKHFAMAIQSQS